MNSPFTPPAKPINPITGPQLDFVCDLQKQVLVINGYSADDVVVFMDAFELRARGLSRAEASGEIDKLKTALAHARTQKFAPTASTAPLFNKDAADESIDGFWEMQDGRIVKVQIAVHGSGNPYAKLLNTDTGSFDYSPGLISEVRRAGTRLPIERAKELGKLYGRCICCGRTLTDEYSIENGIGPICAQKF